MDERFGKYVKGIRRNMGLPVEEIAAKLNMPAMLWLDIENGELKPPRLDKLLKLSEVLHLSAGEHKQMLSLAGNELDVIPDEIRDFVLKNGIAVRALKTYLQNIESNIA
jgi:transcriptional regulator with XRE-family HTH domain